MINRRAAVALLAALPVGGFAAGCATGANPRESHQKQIGDMPPLAGVDRLKTVIVIYPGCTLLDFIGPYTALAEVSTFKFAWLDTAPIASDVGARFLPTATLREVKADVDVLLVPGGSDVSGAIGNQAFVKEVSRIGQLSRYVTSVCTGALILGAAGLLDGYRAATHWTAMDLLPLVGATPVHDRVVKDRNRITAGGVTAGIDFGLEVVKELVGEREAKFSELLMEYDPAPPFSGGSPDKADPEIVELLMHLSQPGTDRAREELRKIRR